MKSDVFAVVMATGIVSIAAADHGYDVISAVLAVCAVIALPVLVVLTARDWRRNRWQLSELDTGLGLFTYVAACAVLVSRFEEHRVAVLVLGGMAVQGWLSLTPVVAKALWRNRWTGLRDRAHGGWELASVATSGMAIVCAAADTVFWALIFWALAMAWYIAMTSLVVWRAAHDKAIRTAPDTWILMGGMAVATLAGDHIHRVLWPGPIADGVRWVTVVTWVLATLWIPVLLAAGLRKVNAWPAVFPLGMYASATFAMAVETGWSWLTVVSAVFCWVAVAAWVFTAVPVAHAFSARFRSVSDR